MAVAFSCAFCALRTKRSKQNPASLQSEDRVSARQNSVCDSNYLCYLAAVAGARCRCAVPVAVINKLE